MRSIKTILQSDFVGMCVGLLLFGVLGYAFNYVYFGFISWQYKLTFLTVIAGAFVILPSLHVVETDRAHGLQMFGLTLTMLLLATRTSEDEGLRYLAIVAWVAIWFIYMDRADLRSTLARHVDRSKTDS